MTDSGEGTGVDVPELQEHLLGEAFEHAPLGVIVLDESGHFLAANKAAAELCGYTRNELLELGSFGLAVDTGIDERLQQVAAGTLRRGSGRMRCKDGAAMEVEYVLGPTRVSGLPFFVGVFWER
jgi:PAS domain S-box-containing protein